MSPITVFAEGRAVIGTDDAEQWGPLLQGCDQRAELSVCIGEGCELGFDGIFEGVLDEDAAGLMGGRDVEEQKQSLVGWLLVQQFEGEIDLVLCGVTIGDAERGLPVAFLKQAGKYGAERALLIEEADASNAEGVVTAVRQPGDDIVCRENAGLVSNGFAAGKFEGEESRMPARGDGSGEKAGEKGLVGGVGEIARGMSALPAGLGEEPAQMGGEPLFQRAGRDIEAERIEGDQQDVVCSHTGACIDHGTRHCSEWRDGIW